MQYKRLWRSLRMYFLSSNTARANYARECGIFGAIGSGCALPRMLVPLYPELIYFGSNVRLGSNVLLVTHDGIHNVINRSLTERKVKEFIGCIKIGDNVFIGANSIVYPNVTIGSNVIIAAGSVVTKSIESGAIVGGNPARVVGSYDTLVERRLNEDDCYPDELKTQNKYASNELVSLLWAKHDERASKARK